MAFLEMTRLYLASVAAAWQLLLLGGLGLVLAFRPRVSERLDRLSPRAQGALFAAIVIVALGQAFRLAWVCDDAFISFRYAANLASGHGLVWNPPERVEGYTNFLWTVLLAGAIWTGLDPGQSAVVLGLAALVGTLLVVARLRARLHRQASPWRFSFAVAGLAVCYSFLSFGTSGLETMAATFCVTLALERALAGAPLSSGLCGVAAAMAHPDHGIFYAALGLALALDREQRRALFRYAAPFVLVYLPYFVLRFAYYGYPFPNTYYAKSGSGSYFSQGVTYLGASFLAGGLWAIAPLVLLGLYGQRWTLFGRYTALALPIYLTYVAKIGGDYMYGRLVVVALPFVYLLAELGACHLLRAGVTPWARTLAFLPFLVPALPTRIIGPREVRWNLADERTHTPLRSFSPLAVDSPMFDRAQLFRRVFADAGLQPRIADNEIGMMGYYTRLPVIDLHGLTDARVARQALSRRGRPGHEKMASPEYLRERGVELSRLMLFGPRYASSTAVSMPDGVPFFFGRWQPALASALGRIPGVSFPDARTLVDRYLEQIDKLDDETIARDLHGFLDPYYFALNPDPARRAALVTRLAVRE